MACILKDKNGTRRIQFYDSDRKRKQIRLGKCPQKLAEAIKVKVEAPITAMAANQPVDAETAKWVSGLETAMANKLAGVGLAPKRRNATLGELLKVFYDRNDVKPSTKVVWEQPRRNLIEFFGESKSIHQITPALAEDFHQYLVGQGLAAWTVHKRLQFCRMLFRGDTPGSSHDQSIRGSRTQERLDYGTAILHHPRGDHPTPGRVQSELAGNPRFVSVRGPAVSQRSPVVALGRREMGNRPLRRLVAQDGAP